MTKRKGFTPHITSGLPLLRKAVKPVANIGKSRSTERQYNLRERAHRVGWPAVVWGDR